MARDDDDPDYERKPARRRRRDDDDEPVVRQPPSGGLDGLFANTSMVALVLFGICCSGIALILGIVGLATCKDPKAKQNAMIVTIIGGVVAVVGTIVQVITMLAQK